VGLSLATSNKKASKISLPRGRVAHLGVETECRKIGRVLVRHGGERRAVGGGDGTKSVGKASMRVAVTHPYVEGVAKRERRQEGVTALVFSDGGAAVLAVRRRHHLAAELLGEQLLAVANAQDGQVERQDVGVDVGGTLVIDRRRATRQNDRLRREGAHLGQR